MCSMTMKQCDMHMICTSISGIVRGRCTQTEIAQLSSKQCQVRLTSLPTEKQTEKHFVPVDMNYLAHMLLISLQFSW